mmetsp:Transcript_5070/g.18949  ORF Transcript_5070/g.18949 Transcript_5070/m.18949 type:complete len:227 (+) Transcript_5070:720-1400(+)
MAATPTSKALEAKSPSGLLFASTSDRCVGSPRRTKEEIPAESMKESMAFFRPKGRKGKTRSTSFACSSNASASLHNFSGMSANFLRSASAARLRSTSSAGGGPARTFFGSLPKTSVFVSVYSFRSRMARSPARPIPELPKPPKGALRMNSQCLLTQTVPARNWLAISLARATSRLQTEPPRPKTVLLARRKASASSSKGMTGTTGPNCSSSTSREPSSMPTTMVGR